MTKKQIELFNSFLSDLNMKDIFQGRFTTGSLTLRSEYQNLSYDDYLELVSEKEVFDFLTSEDSPDRDLWDTTADLWTEALQEASATDNLTEEEPVDAPEREHKASLPDSYKFCPTCWQLKDVNDFGRNFLGIRNSYCRDCYSQYRKSSAFSHETADFSVYEAILINGTIYLNMTLCQLLRDKQMNHCGLRHHEGQLFLVFCEQKHHRNLKFYKNGGVSINDGALAADVQETLGASAGGPYHLHISTNRSKRFDAVTIQVLRAVTHKDYLEHPFVKSEEKPVFDNSNNDELLEESEKAKEAYESLKAVQAQMAAGTETEHITVNNPDDVQQPSTVADDEQEVDVSLSQQQGFPLTKASSTKGYKLCISCLRPLPLSDYHKCASEYDGRNRTCRSCTKSDFSQDSEIYHDAVYFGGRIFFDKYYSESLYDRRNCEVNIDKIDFPHIVAKSPLYYNGSLKSSFTCSQHSGAVALRDEAILNVIEQAFNLDKNHAYFFKLDYRFDNYGNMDIMFCKYQAWYWKEEYPASVMSEEQPTVQDEQAAEAAEPDAEPVIEEPHTLTDEEAKAKMKDFFTLYPSITIKQLHGILSDGYGVDDETGINKYELGLAAYLKERNWKLQMPVRIIKYENF